MHRRGRWANEIRRDRPARQILRNALLWGCLLLHLLTASGASLGYSTSYRYNYGRTGYAAKPQQPVRPPARRTDSRDRPDNGPRQSSSRSPTDIARNYPPSNSPNPQKRTREARLRSLLARGSLPPRQREWVIDKYNRVDNRRIELRNAAERDAMKRQALPSQPANPAGQPSVWH